MNNRNQTTVRGWDRALSEHEPFEAESNRLASAQIDALRGLLTTPDLRALAIKIELAVDI